MGFLGTTQSKCYLEMNKINGSVGSGRQRHLYGLRLSAATAIPRPECGVRVKEIYGRFSRGVRGFFVLHFH
jgi:hypothetical protein